MSRLLMLLLAQAAGLLLFLAANGAQAQVEVEALAGRPFGVGRLRVTDPLGDANLLAAVNGFAIEEKDGRVLYPTFSGDRSRRILGRLLGVRQFGIGRSVTAYFLFQGDEPLEITFSAPEVFQQTVVPRSVPPQVYDELLLEWWEQYRAAAQQQQEQGDYPALVETYLTSMLAQRLQLAGPSVPPVLRQSPNDDQTEEAERTLELLMGVEDLRMEMMLRVMAGRGINRGPADRPVPQTIRWSPRTVPQAPATTQIEPLATHVSPDWFYIRFGTFANYLWLDKFLSEFGSDAQTAASRRGHDSGIGNKMQRQLALSKTALSELFGEAVVQDVAFVGRDTFLREGPAVGMLFEAKNPEVLAQDLQQKQAAALQVEQGRGATLEVVKISGRDVSLLSTPDNRLRSFLAVEGKYHLVTNSRAMVEQFFGVADGGNALADSAEFRYARSRMPVDRDDSMFIYFSSNFLRGLVTPQYQIELLRRMQAVTEIELVQLAQLAAQAEGYDAETIEQLVEEEFLPPNFGRRADGSQLVLSDREWLDVKRGARGTMLPIADTALGGVTDEEARWYEQRAAYYQNQWRDMDPVMIAVQRDPPDDDGVERIYIEGNVSPFEGEKYGWIATILGPPTRDAIAPVPGDAIAAQAVLKGGLVRPGLRTHHLFLGIKDSAPPITAPPNGFLQTLTLLQSIPGYLGTWPNAGFLDMLPIRLESRPDPYGFSRLPFGLWRRQWGDFSVLSFDQFLLGSLPRQLGFERAEHPAQIRLRVEDLSQSELRTLVNALLYERARQVSIGNAKLLHTLSQQLAVPRPEALAVAQRLLDIRLVCPLGGEYELLELPEGLPIWQSTAWGGAGLSSRVPEDYEAPVLHWLRGLDAELTQYEDQVLLRAHVDVQRQPSPSGGFELPLFNLFGGLKEATAPADAEERPEGGREF